MEEDIYKTIHQLSCFVGHPVTILFVNFELITTSIISRISSFSLIDLKPSRYYVLLKQKDRKIKIYHCSMNRFSPSIQYLLFNFIFRYYFPCIFLISST